MLSYRHAFHAGNHADVLKHCVLVQLIRYLTQKDKPFWYIDTHAGAGRYALDSGYALKLSEYREGIGALWSATRLPPALEDYVALVRTANADGLLKVYPGSPDFAQQTMREHDRLRLFERHSSDVKLLQAVFETAGKQVLIGAGDGFAGLKSLLPPPPRRALVLIDPSYEEVADYDRVVIALQEALTRFASGIYMVWYPQLSRRESWYLPQRLQTLPAKNWLHVALRVNKPAEDGFGLHGSGLFILNAPWTLYSTLETVMPYLVRKLGKDAGAHFVLERGD